MYCTPRPRAEDRGVRVEALAVFQIREVVLLLFDRPGPFSQALAVFHERDLAQIVILVVDHVGDGHAAVFGRDLAIADAGDKGFPDLGERILAALYVMVERRDEIGGDLSHMGLVERGDVFVHFVGRKLALILFGIIPQQLERHGGREQNDDRVDDHAEREAQPFALFPGFHPSAPSFNTRIEVGTGRIQMREAVLLI